LSAIAQPNVVFTADGAGSRVDVSALTSFGSTGNNQINATNGAAILDPNLATLDGVALTLDGSATVATALWTKLTNSRLIVSGGTYPLTSLTDLDSTSVSAQAGAQVSLPALTAITNGGNEVALDADGNGTRIDFPALTGLSGAFSSISVSDQAAVNVGGTVINGLAAGNAATIDIPSLPSWLQAKVDVAGGAYTGGTTFDVGQGTNIAISGGAFSGGVIFHVGAGATIDLAGTQVVTYSGTLTGTGPGVVQLSQGELSAGLGGVTFDFAGDLFQWTGGTISTLSGDVTNLGTMNLVGSNGWTLLGSGMMDDFGTIIQSGSGDFGLHNGDPNLSLTLKIEPHAFYTIASDGRFVPQGKPLSALVNAGTIQKTGGTGTSSLIVNGPIDNTGVIEADSGTLDLEPTSLTQLSSGTLSGGAWNALHGATLDFPNGTAITTSAADITLGGVGARISGISTLASNSGSFTVTDGTSFTTAGDSTNSGALTVGAGSTLTVSGNFTQSSAATLHEQIGGAPGSGLFGKVAVTKTANLAGTFSLGLVNGFNPSAGPGYPVLTFNQAPASFATFVGLSPFFTESQGSSSLTLNTIASAADLQVATVSAPTAATSGQSITVDWKVSNPGNTSIGGSWQDSVYLSTTPSITATSILLGTAAHAGGLSSGQSYNASLTTPLGPVTPDFYYVLVQADSLYQVADANRANNTLAAGSGQLNVALPSLQLGQPKSDSFTAPDQDRYYQVAVPAGSALTIALASAASSGSTELYVSHGALPTPYDFDEAAALANQPNQTVTVPQILAAGTYFILAHGVAGAAADAGFTLTASQSSALAVSTFSPNSGGIGQSVTIEIDGTNFSPKTTATLVAGGLTISASNIDFVNPSLIYATFEPRGAAGQLFSLIVQDGAQLAQATHSFQAPAPTGQYVVEPGGGGLPKPEFEPLPLTVALSTPQFIRSGRTGTIQVTYTNPNNFDMVAPLLTIDSTNTSVAFSTPDDSNNFLTSAQLLAVAPTGPAGILRAGQSAQLTLTILSNDPTDNDQIPINVSQIASGFPDAPNTIDWSALETGLRPAAIPSAAWTAIFSNLLPTLGMTIDSYVAALAHAATYLGDLGETTAQTSDVNRLWSFLVSQANAVFPTATLVSTIDAALPTPGKLSLAIDRTFSSSIAGRYTQGIFGLGWTTSWQSTLSKDALGNVTIQAGGRFAYFVTQTNGSYLDTVGEYGTLTSSSGVFTFIDTAGTKSVFRADGSFNFVQDTNGNRITIAYNAQNQPVTLTYANPADPAEPAETLTLTYANGLVSQVADGTGNTWTYAYSSGLLTSVTAPGNLLTSYAYHADSPTTANALASISHPNGAQDNFSYDVQGRLKSTSQNGGANAITYAYPGQAAVTTTDLANNQTTVWFNDLGLPSRTQDSRGAISTYQYDANGNVATITDALGEVYHYAYDGNGNLTQIVDPLAHTVHMTYGQLSNMTAITDAAGNRTQYNYDSAGNLLSITYPDSTRQAFAYDPLGNLSDTVLQNGDPIAYQSNAQGLLAKQTFADGSSQAFIYDAHGNLQLAKTFDSAGTLTGTTSLLYNAANELTSISYPNGQQLSFTYNAAGQRVRSVDQDGFTVNYAYDTLGRLAKLLDSSNNTIVQFTYNTLGQLSRKDNGNGTYTTYGYDAAGNLTSIVNFAAATTVNSSFTYTYNLLGQQTSVTDQANNVTKYAYDATGQLTQVTLPGGTTIAYIYNAAGDRTEVINGNTTTSYASNVVNEITQVGSATYTYDQNGNLHTATDSSGTKTYTYNDLNQLVSIAVPDGTLTKFQYSPLGFLVGTSVNGAQANYLIDPTGLGNVVGSYNGSNSLIAHYNYGRGLVSQTGPSGTGYYDFDAIGNTVGITGAGGGYVNKYSYLPFGETTTVSAALPNLFTFIGQFGVMQIGDKLSSMRARNYAPATGQFLSNDPSGPFAPGRDINGRRYAANSPVNAIDPRGLATFALNFSGSGGAGVGATLSSSLVWDGSSVIPDWQTTIGGGLYEGAGASTTVGFTVTSAASANDLTGYSYEYGASAGEFLVGGYEVVSGSNYAGGGLNAGLGIGTPVELHQLNTFTLSSKQGWKQIVEKFWHLTSPPQLQLRPRLSAPPVTNHSSLDPNALLGPAGFGAHHFVSPTSILPYTIEFENDGSVAAQVVTISEQLDPNLDWSSFQLQAFGFGRTDVVIAAGVTEYENTVAYQNTDGSALNVLVSFDFNVQTGLLTGSFISLDPLTGQAPTGVFDGFLPPDDKSGVGEGFVQYTVKPKANLTTGATISQQAAIVFDTNAPLNTGVATNTLDTGVPTGTVQALPGISPTSFNVSWTGVDDASGSGVGLFNVFVSDNGGPFAAWQTATNQTSATFVGQLGHSYGFYATATDNVGNAQAQPAAAQTTTTVPAEKKGAYVAGAYEDVLGRSVDASGLAYWTTQLDSGQARTVVANLIDHSAEYFATIITPAYQQFLGRAPDAAGLAYWVGKMQNGLTDEQLEAGFIGSPEYYTHSGGTNQAWVDAMYNNLLGRAPDAGGDAYWIQQLAHGANRTSVAFGFAASSERESEHITADYLKYLGRVPDGAGLSFWLDQFVNHGKTNEDLITGFLASDEYFAKHTS
jgi:RHS repeat-associated protein